MVVVRRHWALVLAIPLLILASILALFQYGGDSRKVHAQVVMAQAVTETPAPPAAAAPPSVSVQVYQLSQQLRAELALTTQDMAAMGFSSSTATSVLNAIKTFADSSASSLANADAIVQQVRQHLQETNRKINVGPRNEELIASVPVLKQNIAAAQAQRDLVMASLVNQVSTFLTPDQQAMWEAARANATTASQMGITAPGPYRYVTGLTDAQIQRLDSVARQRGRAGVLAAGSDMLNTSQLNQLQAAQQNQQVAIAAVSVAEAQLLPRIDALKNRIPPRPVAVRSGPSIKTTLTTQPFNLNQ